MRAEANAKKLVLARHIPSTPANLPKEKKAAARKRENQRARLGKREKRAAEKTLSVASAHRKANAAKESREATDNTNSLHAAGDSGGCRACARRFGLFRKGS